MNKSLSYCRYIERFRYGLPQSREDRLREAAEEEDGGFWWMSTSPPSSSTPTQASDKHARGFLTWLLNTSSVCLSNLKRTCNTKFKHYILIYVLHETCAFVIILVN